MPEIFDQLEAFESWFDFSALKEKEGHKEILVGERKNHIISSLHAILKPFLLRRVKADVETSLPKKREYILYAPLTGAQKELYRHILEGDSRAYLEEKVVERLTSSRASTPKSTNSLNLKRKAGSGVSTPNKSAKSSRGSTPAGSFRSRTSNKKRKDYREKSDSEFFRDLERRGMTESDEGTVDEEEQEAIERAKTIALASKSVSFYNLSNTSSTRRSSKVWRRDFANKHRKLDLQYFRHPRVLGSQKYSNRICCKSRHHTIDDTAGLLQSRLLTPSEYKLTANRKRDLGEEASKSHHATPTCMRFTAQLLLALV